MAKYVGALDQGTTSNRFIIFDHSGRIIGVDQKEHEQIFPKPGWVEHDPLEIWRNTQDVIRTALAKANLTGSDLAAIGITNQRETTVIWDKNTGKPVANAIVWTAFAIKPDCRLLPIFRVRKSNGFWTTLPRPAPRSTKVRPFSGLWKPGSSGGSPADPAVGPMSPM